MILLFLLIIPFFFRFVNNDRQNMWNKIAHPRVIWPPMTNRKNLYKYYFVCFILFYQRFLVLFFFIIYLLSFLCHSFYFGHRRISPRVRRPINRMVFVSLPSVLLIVYGPKIEWPFARSERCEKKKHILKIYLGWETNAFTFTFSTSILFSDVYFCYSNAILL